MEIGGVGSDRQATPPLTASTRLVHSKSASAAIVRLVGTWAVSGILGALILATFVLPVKAKTGGKFDKKKLF